VKDHFDLEEINRSGTRLWIEHSTPEDEMLVNHILWGETQISENDAKMRNSLDLGGRKVMGLLMMYLQTFLDEPKIPNTLKGILPGMLNPVQRMFIYLNILKPIDLNDKPSKILKLINTKGTLFKTTQEEFVNPTYIPVQKGKHNMLQVFIKNGHDEFVPFMNGTVVLTLHFQRVKGKRR
jgi:hypothetical protein